MQLKVCTIGVCVRRCVGKWSYNMGVLSNQFAEVF